MKKSKYLTTYAEADSSLHNIIDTSTYSYFDTGNSIQRNKEYKTYNISSSSTSFINDVSSSLSEQMYATKWDATDTTTINQNYKNYLPDYSITNTDTMISYGSGGGWVQTPLTPVERMQEILAAGHAPAFHRSRTMLCAPCTMAETRARETLRRIIGEKNYRRFVRDGFITVRAKSGLVYCIHPGHGMTDVYLDGKPVDRLCVVLKGNFPPTDSLLMRYLLILNDEGEFSKFAIKHSVSQRVLPFVAAPVLALPEQWSALKLKVA